METSQSPAAAANFVSIYETVVNLILAQDLVEFLSLEPSEVSIGILDACSLCEIFSFDLFLNVFNPLG